ncbi:MAG TPA: ATP synthase F1 subunit gamma [Phycisphaerae bacterium]|nr:ATP synthase F1 subunit gamma [Phycisphaerae bacterium]HUT61844.1 ATP synthase F1 subunit gamma [Phycisphaerae bacterium]
MAKARRISRHIRTVRNIHGVTRAMHLVSTLRFRRAYDSLGAVRPYVASLVEMAADAIARAGEPVSHPLLEGDESVRREVLLVLSSRRGLCGAYNNGVARIAAERTGQLADAGYDVLLRCAGKRGQLILESKGFDVDRTYDGFDRAPDARTVGLLADELMREFLDGAVSGLEVAYTQFVSSGRQRPAIAQILPLTQLEPPKPVLPTAAEPVPYECMPSASELLEILLPEAARMKLYQCFVDAHVSEQIARMTAMRSATDSAEEMIRDLTARYHRARQAQITTELAEIMGGREGVEAS